MKATLLAMLALFVSLASSTEAARRLITSKDIKNGTIRLVDLHPQTKAELSLSVRTVHVTAPVAPGEFGQVTASCPQEERPLGGGFGFAGDTIQSSATTSGWWVSGYNDLNVSLTLHAYAYCAPHVTALQPIP